MTEIDELIEEYAEAYAELFWQREEGSGPAVDRAEAWFASVSHRIRLAGFDVGLDKLS
jgi:hypothetical protein